MGIYYSDDQVTVHHGDCLDVMRSLPDNSIDAVVTDPPYDLTAGKKGGSGAASVNVAIGTGNGAGGFMGKRWDATGVAFDPATWVEVLRVLKPGGHLLAFGAPRTWHRLVCAIEDAGFELRDQIAAWLYGSGFPKSLDVSKAIDKAAGAEREVLSAGAPVKRMIPGADQNATGSWIKDNGREFVPTVSAPATEDAQRWAGWGTALKPAWEPIQVARKPLRGTVVENVLRYGTGAVNIGGCLIEASGRPLIVGHGQDTAGKATYGANGPGGGSHNAGSTDAGRWPANVVLDEAAAAELDRQTGTLTSGANPTRRSADKFRDAYGEFTGQTECTPARGADAGGASRFFYVAKAPAVQRPKHGQVAHPTVKPLDLMQWLCRLYTPPGGLILDPFGGSGTTAEAALREGFRCTIIEREADYLPLIVARVSRPINHVFQFEED